MSQTPFIKFAELCKTLESTTKRGQKVQSLANFLNYIREDEVIPAITFMNGRPFPESDERVLDVGGQTAWKLLRRRGQLTLLTKPVTLLDVYQTFDQISRASGSGSRLRKESLLAGLLGRLSDFEAEYLLRIIFGEMRVGAVEGVVLESIALASDLQLEFVRRAYMFLGNLGDVANLCLTRRADVQSLGVELFVPIKPMLAEMATNLEEVFEEYGGTTAFEYKYDGARIQIHRRNEKVRIFSRRLTDVTESLPDVVQIVRDNVLGSQEFLMEGEVIATGQNGRPVPFQDLMRRFRRVHAVQSMAKEIPLRLFLFDVIYLNGKLQIDLAYDERWAELQQHTSRDLLATRLVTNDIAEAQRMMDESIASGHEGLMAKALSSKYVPGARGKNWFKIKPAETIDVVILAADWGSGRRRGWLSNYHLAVRDEESGEYLEVGKTFKGLTDSEFSAITSRLLKIKTIDSGYTVHVRPSIVVEVAFNEIQLSPHYPSKFALRFARIIRFREDKPVEEVDTLQRLERLYESQFRYKDRVDV